MSRPLDSDLPHVMTGAAEEWSVDRGLRYTAYNAAHAATMREMYGVELELGRSALDALTLPADRQAEERHLAAALSGETLVARLQRGGRRAPFDLAYVPFYDRSGEVAGVRMEARPVTQDEMLGPDQRSELRVVGSAGESAEREGPAGRLPQGPNRARSRALSRELFERIRASQLVGESRKRLHRSLQAARAGYWEWDPVSGDSVWSDELWDVYDVAPEARTPEPDTWMNAIHPDDRAEARDTLALAAAAGEPFSCEYRINTADGSRRWVHSQGVAEFDEQGQIARYFGVDVDVTDRKLAEEEARSSDMKLGAAMESMTSAVSISDLDGRFMDFNEAFATFHRFPDKAACARTLAEYPDLLEVQFENGTPAPLDRWPVSRGLSGETAVDEIYLLRRKDTGESWTASYNFAPIRDAGGEIVGSVVTAQDITQERLMERALAESEEKFRTVADFTHNWEFWRSPEGDLLYTSPSCERLTGYSPQEFLADPELFFTVVHPDDRPELRRHLDQSSLPIGDEHEHEIEFRITRKDGEERWMAHRCSRVIGADGKDFGIRGSNVDITRRKVVEAERARLLEEAQDLALQLHARNEELLEKADELAAEKESLRESETRFRSLFEHAPVPMWEEDHSAVKAHLESLAAAGVADVVAHVLADAVEYERCMSLCRGIDANPAAVKLFAASSKDELIARNRDLYSAGTHSGVHHIWRAMLSGRRTVTYEDAGRRLDGETVDVVETVTVLPGHEDRWDRVYVVNFDVTERKRSEQRLHDSEQRLRSLVDGMLEGLAYCQMLYDEHGEPEDIVFLSVNPAFVRLTGVDPVEKRVTDYVPDAQAVCPEVWAALVRVAAGGGPEEVDLTIPGVGWFRISAYCPAPQHLVAVFEDVTHRREAEWQSARTLEFLAILNADVGVEELVRDVVTFVHGHSGADAVGIRLQDGVDYPYYETRGFDESFVLAESPLCARDPDGNALCDAHGDPVLECMCGNVIRGRVDGSQPFTTPQGSFWSNDTTRLLATTTDEDRWEHRRNRCIGEGYESVLLIPLKAGREPLGLLQMNSMRANAYTESSVAFWEWLAGYLAAALGKQQAEARQRETAVRLEHALDGALSALGATVELRDPYTAGHERRVAALAVAIARRLGWNEERVSALRMAAEIHDVGKVGVPAEILAKPTRLGEHETNIIQTHPQVGHDLLSGIEFQAPVAEIVLQHHERLNGSGYPKGMRGQEILPEARVLAVADVVEAMASYRPYRPALGIAVAFDEIRKGAGTLYDVEASAACDQVFADGFEFPT